MCDCSGRDKTKFHNLNESLVKEILELLSDDSCKENQLLGQNKTTLLREPKLFLS